MVAKECAESGIGVFDSGVGGLSVLREIHRLLPGESLLYVADSGHAPYGEKTPEYIRQRCRQIAGFLLERGAKALVLACNTATAAAAADLRECYPNLPVIGMEPAVKPAAAASRNGVVGVLATSGTLQSARFAGLLDRFAGDVKVITQPCPGLMERVESGDLQGPETERLLRRYLRPLVQQGCDTLVLGCTHYPFLKPLLRRLLPPEVALVDTGLAVARQLERCLNSLDLRSVGSGTVSFWSSGQADRTHRLLPLLWGSAAPVADFPG